MLVRWNGRHRLAALSKCWSSNPPKRRALAMTAWRKPRREMACPALSLGVNRGQLLPIQALLPLPADQRIAHL